MATSPDERAAVAHLLRRTGFGPHPGQVEAAAARGLAAAIDDVLAAPAQDPGPDPSFKEDSDEPPKRWLSLMARPSAGLHEKMVWFWHGHLTTSEDKVGDWHRVYAQHRLLRDHAFGNFRELLQAVTIDPAMLEYLDGDGSTADAPNENYGRELMELFALGRGNYGQADVRAAAIALSGWSVDDNGRATFDSGAGPSGPVQLLGRPVTDAHSAVDVVCDHPACASWVSGRLYRFLAGRPAPASTAKRLADDFRSSGLEIRPLVENIIRDPSFWDAHLTRPRYPVEWTVAAAAAFGTEGNSQALLDACSTLNQVPFQPPNVSGWPFGRRWLSAAYAAAKASLAIQGSQTEHAAGVAAVRDAPDPVASAIDRTSLFELSSSTRAAMTEAARSMSSASTDPDSRAAVLLALAVASPEFALA